MEPQQVPLGAIKTHPALQPRDLQLLHTRDRLHQEKRSAGHIEDMAKLLKLDPKAQLVPVQLADVGGALYVVDGHHRFKAYKRAGRKTVPALVEAMTMQQASHRSKLANVTHARLEMHSEQKSNALWHHLNFITQGGTLSLPDGESLRKLGGRFGKAPETVRSMIRRLPEVEPERFAEKHRDGITGWPHWKYVRNTARNELYRALTPDGRTDWEADKYVKKLMKLWEGFDRAAVLKGHEKLLAEGVEPDLLRELEATYWAAMVEPDEPSDF